jgi:hypothetical protein
LWAQFQSIEQRKGKGKGGSILQGKRDRTVGPAVSERKGNKRQTEDAKEQTTESAVESRQEIAERTRQTAERANMREQREREKGGICSVCSIFNMRWSRELGLLLTAVFRGKMVRLLQSVVTAAESSSWGLALLNIVLKKLEVLHFVT